MKMLTILFILSLTSLTFAQDKLPQVSKPKELTQGRFSEGTMTKLNLQDVQKFIPWAKSAKRVLTKALKDAKVMPLTERSSYIKSIVEKVVTRSGGKRYQTLLRFSLNRGLFLVDELTRESNMLVKGTIENQLDILTRAIKIGLKFYESDLDYQKRIEAGKSAVEVYHAKYGIVLAKEFAQASVNVLDASAQYRTLYKTLEMLNWDLSQDRQARDYSEVIWDLYQGLERMPEQSNFNDQVNIANVRKLNLLKERAFKVIKSLGKRNR